MRAKQAAGHSVLSPPSPEISVEDEQFLRMRSVIKLSGLSKSELYRQVGKGRFPAPQPYPQSARSVFWLLSEVRAWMRGCLGSAEDDYIDRLGLR